MLGAAQVGLSRQEKVGEALFPAPSPNTGCRGNFIFKHNLKMEIEIKRDP